MSILITGAGGMLGSHMIDYFYDKKLSHDVIGTYYKPTTFIEEIEGKSRLVECDVRYFTNIYDILNNYKPDRIFHLAAQSYPAVSLTKPQETFEVNVTGTINLFESIRRIQGYDPVVIMACSSAEYGSSLEDYEDPVDESVDLLPLHPYGVSKVAQDLLTYQYYKNYGIKGIRARIFNTTGPRKVNDVCADFTGRVVKMENDSESDHKLRVGNLEVYRAIMDVRDLVKALILLSEKGVAGEVYNVSGSSIYKISELIEVIRKYTDIKFEIYVDQDLLRPTDEKIISGNSKKLIDHTGWNQSYNIETTIKDMLNYWRKVIR